MKRKHLATLAIASSLALALTACANGGEGTTNDDNGDNGATTGGVLKIGVGSAQSGPSASSGLSLLCTTEAYVKNVNDEGGIGGYTFEVISRDHQYDPSRSAAIAQEFVNEEVFAMLTDGTAPMQAALPILEPNQIPLFATSDGGVFTPPPSDYVFGINPSYAREALGGARFILEDLGVDEIGFVYLNSAAGEPAAAVFEPFVEENGGTVVSSDAIAATATDYAPYAHNLKESGATVVYSFLLDTGLASLQKAASAIGYDPTWVSWFPAYTGSYLELAGDLSEGVYVSEFTTPITETDDPAVQAYLDIVPDTCPDLYSTQAAQSASSFADALVEGVRRLVDAGEDVTGANLAEALRGDNQEFGLTPSVTWNDESVAGATKAAMFKIVDGILERQSEYAELPAL